MIPFLILALLPAFQGAPDPAFKKELDKLAAQNDRNGMGKLVKAQTASAVAWIVSTCEALAEREDAEKEALVKVLEEAWKAGMATEFVQREYQALKGLGANRRDRNDLKSRLDQISIDFESNLERKDDFAFQNVVDELDVVAPGLEQVGDFYRASEAYALQARACDEPVRAESADLPKAVKSYAQAVSMCEKIDLKDGVHGELVKRHAALVAGGHDKRRDAPLPPRGEEAPAASLGPPLNVALKFEPVPSLDTYLRPNFMCDDVFVLWAPLALKAKGSQATFQRLENAPAALRVGAGDVRMDTNRNGQGDETDQKLALSGNPVLVQMKLGEGEGARPWAFLVQVGGRQDQYQGIEVNFDASDASYTVYTISASSVVGDVAGTPVRIIDDSMDGSYGDQPQSWGEPGLTPENFQPEMDAIVIGSSKRARPWSEVQEIGGKWYRIDPDKVGTSFQATPLALETGTLKLDFKGGPAPTWVVVRGSGETLKNSYFDIVEGGAKGVSVPVGRYTLFYGEVRKGKKRQVQKTLILPGKSSPSFEVKKGETTVVPLGAPFGFDFRFKRDGSKLTVDGKTVSVVGRSEERYERPWNCVSRPEVVWRKKGTKAGSKPEKMPVVSGTEGIEKYGWEATFFPLELTLDLKQDKDPIEVQLIDKKHDLFGKIESAWKPE
ncbi:MAG: hypothetical protein ACKVXR_09750 [Planctomycetota bacterium]